MTQTVKQEQIADPQVQRQQAVAVLTSGGDSQGMNAAVRAVVRTALRNGAKAFAVFEGLQGLVDGGERIQEFTWGSVSSILPLGGTVIGTARSLDFRERQGRLKAAENLVRHGIDRLVVIGGDGSLTGTDIFRAEWPSLIEELLGSGRISSDQAAAHRRLFIAGTVGSIDNDMVGTDKTIGADSAMHRIMEAVDALSATASSHQRSFVVEVMGRHCGYLTVICALAGGADFVFIPEQRPGSDWQDRLVARLRSSRAAGRRDSLVLVAEGVEDENGQPVTAQMVADVMTQQAGEDTRVTILGHVQRGGAPSAYDRWMPTLMGHAAALEVLGAADNHVSQVIGVRHNRVAKMALVDAVAATKAIPDLITRGEYEAAMTARGESFTQSLRVFEAIAAPEPVFAGQGTRIAVMHVGGLAPGMNAAVRAAVRFGISRGHEIIGINGGVPGLLNDDTRPLGWESVDGWAHQGGAELGTSRVTPSSEEFVQLGEAIQRNNLSGLLVIGGHRAYEALWRLRPRRGEHPGLKVPILLLPASIDNNLPGWEMTIGADTALNVIVSAVDAIKQSASASNRAFVVETMGRRCGFLAAMAALSVGAEGLYLNEDPPNLARLNANVNEMVDGFAHGRRFHLSMRNEFASVGYTTDFLCQLFAEESGGAFEARTMVLGHLQQGANPTAFDRAHAARAAAHGIDWLTGRILAGRADWHYATMIDGAMGSARILKLDENYDMRNRRPLNQWWMQYLAVMDLVK